MLKSKSSLYYLDLIANTFELLIAFILLVVIAIKVVEVIFSLAGNELVIIALEFERVLSIMLALVIGVEFTKMLFKHTPESVIEVLLFAIARQVVMYHEQTIEMLIGTLAIAGIFAIKKFLISSKDEKKQEPD